MATRRGETARARCSACSTNRRIRPLPVPTSAVKLEKRLRSGAANTLRHAEEWLTADDSGAEANR